MFAFIGSEFCGEPAEPDLEPRLGVVGDEAGQPFGSKGPEVLGAIQLVQSGAIPSDESVVICITGNGYKTAAETIGSRVAPPVQISRSLQDFEAYLRSSGEAAVVVPGGH